MYQNELYFSYSTYLKEKYGEKVYKLPVNLPVTCPNRIGASGCIFCAPVGTGFESLDNSKSVAEQLAENKAYIMKRYHAKRFIAYFQNYTNTFLPLPEFRAYMEAAAATEDIVEISVSTRPDCINDEYLDVLAGIRERYHTEITVELGLQTVNYHTLDQIQRGHGLAEFLDAVLRIQPYGFPVCVHVILNLPGDTDRDALECAKILSALPVHIVKVHSLYIPKNTELCKAYENGTIGLCEKEAYIERLMLFLTHLRKDLVIERLFSRVPEQDAVFSNWGTSWWKLKDELEAAMKAAGCRQGSACDYLNGKALKKLTENE